MSKGSLKGIAFELTSGFSNVIGIPAVALREQEVLRAYDRTIDTARVMGGVLDQLIERPNKQSWFEICYAGAQRCLAASHTNSE